MFLAYAKLTSPDCIKKKSITYAKKNLQSQCGKGVLRLNIEKSSKCFCRRRTSRIYQTVSIDSRLKMIQIERHP